ncbi:hypothetical protein DCC85_03800 [Paenibacillus sp. CAA11]|uniref:McrB family protein n=1 Tax=Paenibacillus sp. CAA11 TaxID=1532905 RepID=UPI000D3B262E|nr:hypothetical protein [Paenibacillus sp. CAA11]AWB43431.1 hypothetical protein DCC85_03800 [Paenibacillus sp. CAA11]
MPRPNEKKIPDYEYWSFVQKDCTPNDLANLASNICSFDSQDYNANKENILSFLPGSAADKVKAWSDYWVTIMQTLALAYITPRDNLLHKTALAQHITDGNPVDGFYYYWALRFQFPFAQSKHKGYKENQIVVQPIISILEHLVGLFEKAVALKLNPYDHSYLTFEEIVLVLMKSESNSIYEVKRNVNKIHQNRAIGYTYDDLKIDGFNEIMNNFSSRARLYFEKFNLLIFDRRNGKVIISDDINYSKIKSFLVFRKKALTLTTDEQTRLDFFNSAFLKLNPNPNKLLEVVSSVSGVMALSGQELVGKLTKNLSDNGVFFDDEFIESFLLSLKTKPFVILSGISGVGKSILPRTIMQLSGNKECSPIAVAPDWTDNSDMLGYFNVDGDFIPGEFTNLVLEANDNPHLPYFIILDEMNLSRVEYYFAQVLSVLESRYFDEDINRISYHDFLFNKGIRDRLQRYADKNSGDPELHDYFNKLAQLKISSNVFIIGTVNIDESTYPFSKKVLDRSNVLEINEVNLMIGVNDDTGLKYIDVATAEANTTDVGNAAEETGGTVTTEETEGTETTQEAEGTDTTQEAEGTDANQALSVAAAPVAPATPVAPALTELQQEEGKVFLFNYLIEGKITNLIELKQNWIQNQEITLELHQTLSTWIALLENINRLLKPLKLNFGFRVRDEVCIYLYHAACQNYDTLADGTWWNKYFDNQLVQKILPRLSGEQGEIDQVIIDLYNLCTQNGNYDADKILQDDTESDDLRFPKAARKLYLMLKDLLIFDKPSTSFWSV